MRTLYQLLVYRLYKLARITRSDEDAVLAAGLTLGGLIWWWIVLVIELLKLRDYLPKNSILILLIGSCLINIYVSSRDQIRSEMITKGNDKSFPTACHVLAWLLFIWTFLGPSIIVFF